MENPLMGRAASIATILLLTISAQAGAQQPGYGELEYQSSCSGCHGMLGRGDGPLAPELESTPADLTGLAAANGGEFPYWKVIALIDGRFVVPGHGTREMPVWGREFLIGDAATYGPNGGEAVTRERISALAEYIATLQR
jgi:mono/diheme cytochrome c family protein